MKIHTQGNFFIVFFGNIKNGNGDNLSIRVYIYMEKFMANYYDMVHESSQNHNFKEYIRIRVNNFICYNNYNCY